MAVGVSFDEFNSNRSFGSPNNYGSSGGGSSWTQTIDRSQRTFPNGAPNPYYNPDLAPKPAPAPAPLTTLGKTLQTVSFGPSGTPSQVPAGQAVSGGIGGINTGSTSLADLTGIADPWSSQRGQYQTQLSSLMKDPSSFLQSDLFKASTAAGLEGVNRSAAAGGMLKSGNRLQALMDYGQKNAPDNFFRMADLLGGYAGAKNQNPGGGLNAASQFMNNATSQYNADTSRYSAENNARIGQFNADTARQGNAQQAQLAQTQNDTATQRWQQQQQQQQDQWQYQQQQQQNADLQRQMQEQLNLAMNYR